LSEAKAITSAILLCCCDDELLPERHLWRQLLFKVNRADRHLRDRMGDAGFFLAYDTSE
jgi:hypothetical protein